MTSQLLRAPLSDWCRAILVLFALGQIVAAEPVIWTGPSTSFSKLGTADPALPQNQDRLTDNVWITRGGALEGGIFNIAPGKETAYVRPTSPADTEWATDMVGDNMGKAITASNGPNLMFTTWAAAYGGPGPDLIDHIFVENAVVHLISDDIYLDLKFTQFDLSGLVAYDRSAPAVAPTGDYNGNGTVDAADYVRWRDTLDQPAVPPGSGADGNLSGDIDQGDYDFWRAHFGEIVQTGNGSGQTAAVPEPAAFVLTLVGLNSFFWFALHWARAGNLLTRRTS